MRIFAAAILLSSTAVLAEPVDGIVSSAPTPSYELGLRIGGYGFRREGDMRPGDGWTECRMNGFGVFGTRSLTGPLFLEAGLDMYTSAAEPDERDLPVDRTSGLISAAIGARTDVTSWLRGYVQVGGGVELTKVSVAYGEETIRDQKAMPEGFFGAGFDLKIMKNTYVGASMRTLVMGNFDYDPKRLDPDGGWVTAPPADEVFDESPGFAAQAQFYVRRTLQ